MKGRAFSIWGLMVTANLSREKLEAFQFRQLKRLVRHAFDRVPFYRDLYREKGFDPDSLHSLADLSAIPIVSKEDLVNQPPRRMVSRGLHPGRLHSRSTSGTTGLILTVRCSWIEERILSLIRLRALLRMGLRLTDRFIRVRNVASYRQTPPGLLALSRLGLLRWGQVDSFLPWPEIIRQLRKARPQVIGGYPGMLSILAERMSAEDREAIGARLVFVGGDQSTPALRKRVEEGFQAPVLEIYGSHEFVLLAWECPDSGLMHICEEGVLLEVLSDDRPASPGESGEVVATALHSFSQPFIRYRLGDRATFGGALCPCGLPYRTIRRIEGRETEYLSSPTLGLVSPYQLFLWLDEQGWVRQYRLLQDSAQTLSLQLVVASPPSTGQTEQVLKRLREVFGPGMEYRIQVAEQLSFSPSGKFKLVENRLHTFYPQSQ